MYAIENYKDNIRFNNQYNKLRDFLKTYADDGYNEHFHWGRLDWMMSHSYLDVEMLTKNAMFRDESGELVGAVLYDTGFEKQYSESVLEVNLSQNLSYQLPEGFYINDTALEIDNWQWHLVIYHGFDHEGIPEESSEEVVEAEKHLDISEYIKVFAIKDGEYTAHCGVWYSYGDTAYIEPVVTVPEHRGKGLGKAVVYEAISRAKERGAKRAIVLSDQDFYLHIGMRKSSEVATWVKNGK